MNGSFEIYDVLRYLGDRNTPTSALVRLMRVFTSFLYHITGRLGPGSVRELPPQRLMAFGFQQRPELLDQRNPIGVIMALAIVAESVRRHPDVVLGLASSAPRPNGERDTLPIFQLWPWKRMLRAINLVVGEMMLIGQPTVPFVILRSHLKRLVSNVLGVYDLALRGDQDVPGGLRGAHVENIILSMIHHPELVARLVHQVLAEATPLTDSEEFILRRFVDRYWQSVQQGMNNPPRQFGPEILRAEEVYGPARFSTRSCRDPRFVAMAEHSFGHLVPGWTGMTSIIDKYQLPEFHPSWQVGEWTPGSDEADDNGGLLDSDADDGVDDDSPWLE